MYIDIYAAWNNYPSQSSSIDPNDSQSEYFEYLEVGIKLRAIRSCIR